MESEKGNKIPVSYLMLIPENGIKIAKYIRIGDKISYVSYDDKYNCLYVCTNIGEIFKIDLKHNILIKKQIYKNVFKEGLTLMFSSSLDGNYYAFKRVNEFESVLFLIDRRKSIITKIQTPISKIDFYYYWFDNSSKIMVGYYDKSMFFIYDISKNNFIKEVDLKTFSPGHTLKARISPDGSMYLSPKWNDSLYVLDKDGQKVNQIKFFPSPLWSPNGAKIATYSRIIDINGKDINTLYLKGEYYLWISLKKPLYFFF
jgi:WD40 repeat protein